MARPQDDRDRSPSPSDSEPLVPFPIPGPSELQRQVMAMASPFGHLVPVTSLSRLHPRRPSRPARQNVDEEMPPPPVPNSGLVEAVKQSLMVVLKVPNLARLVRHPRQTAFIDTPPDSRRPSATSAAISRRQEDPSGRRLHRPSLETFKLQVSTGIQTGNIPVALHTPDPTPTEDKFPTTTTSHGEGQHIGPSTTNSHSASRSLSYIPRVYLLVDKFDSMGKYASEREMELRKEAGLSLVVKLKVPSLFSELNGFFKIDGKWMQARTAVSQGHVLEKRYILSRAYLRRLRLLEVVLKEQGLFEEAVKQAREQLLGYREEAEKDPVVVSEAPSLSHIVSAEQESAVPMDITQSLAAEPQESTADDRADVQPMMHITRNDEDAEDAEGPSGSDSQDEDIEDAEGPSGSDSQDEDIEDAEGPSGSDSQDESDISAPTNHGKARGPTLKELVDSYIPEEFGCGTLIHFQKSAGAISPPQVNHTDRVEALAMETVRKVENTPQDHNVFTDPIPCMVCEETDGHKYDCRIGNFEFNDNPSVAYIEEHARAAERAFFMPDEESIEDQMMIASGTDDLTMEEHEEVWNELMDAIGEDPNFPGMSVPNRILAHVIRTSGTNAQPITPDNFPPALLEFDPLEQLEGFEGFVGPDGVEIEM